MLLPRPYHAHCDVTLSTLHCTTGHNWTGGRQDGSQTVAVEQPPLRKKVCTKKLALFCFPETQPPPTKVFGKLVKIL